MPGFACICKKVEGSYVQFSIKCKNFVDSENLKKVLRILSSKLSHM